MELVFFAIFTVSLGQTIRSGLPDYARGYTLAGSKNSGAVDEREIIVPIKLRLVLSAQAAASGRRSCALPRRHRPLGGPYFDGTFFHRD